MAFQHIPLPHSSTQTVLGFGAWLKNTACLLDGDNAYYSNVHGDLGTPEARLALQASVPSLLQVSGGRVAAVAHDLHPDFYSTELAQEWGQRLQVPVFGVQHHAAHIAAVLAEHGVREPALGLALDGVGLGDDGRAWGGEVLLLQGGSSQRLDGITSLHLPGGDKATEQVWRMGVSLLWALGRKAEISNLFIPRVGSASVKTALHMLQKDLNCPLSSGAGRWFDAMAALLLNIDTQEQEAQAAMALEQCAQQWLETQTAKQQAKFLQRIVSDLSGAGGKTYLDLLSLADRILEQTSAGQAAAYFHVGLAQRLVLRTAQLAQARQIHYIALGGGCFLNVLLREHTVAGLQALGFSVLLPQQQSFGDAGLALGQAWIGAHQLESSRGVCGVDNS